MTQTGAQSNNMTSQNLIAVREADHADAAWIGSFLRAHWHATAVVAHGEIIDAALLPALIAGNHQGLVTYRGMAKMRSWLQSMRRRRAWASGPR